jgi:hypothetical protein
MLTEVLDRERDYGPALVSAALESLVQFKIVKRGALSRLCYRFGKTPAVRPDVVGTVPSIEVEQRSLSVYDEVAA